MLLINPWLTPFYVLAGIACLFATLFMFFLTCWSLFHETEGLLYTSKKDLLAAAIVSLISVAVLYLAFAGFCHCLNYFLN